ncbi:MAG TPA: hypothetical protein VHG69_10475 [Thermoleophilaceae bacterium]|nr:hypothetical protein [Thermoleophilaceae bacterium]
MLATLRARLTYANVMATIAVFIAIGGSSYAALRVTGRNVPRDALTGADVKNLTGRDVRNNSLTGADVRNLTGADVTNGRLLAEDFAPGQLPRGEQGAPGPPGEPATRLFAFIGVDTGSFEAEVVYGSGVLGVERVGVTGGGEYDVAFNRDLTGCVASITPGHGKPNPDTADFESRAHGTAMVDPDDTPGSKDNVVRTFTYFTGNTSDQYPVSFFITVFC